MGSSPTCLEGNLGALTPPDTSPSVAPGEGRFFLVRGDNACVTGRYQTASDGSDRVTAACP